MHYPVVDKNGETIAAAVTNLDLHDIARAAKTYGLKSYYVVTPLHDQIDLLNRLLDHWREGYGAGYNPRRKIALELIRVEENLPAVIDRMTAADKYNRPPTMVATTARSRGPALGYAEFRAMLADGKPYLMLLGTAWGLAEELLDSADYILKPIDGGTGYNHLSVRSAAAIMFDRLFCR